MIKDRVYYPFIPTLPDIKNILPLAISISYFMGALFFEIQNLSISSYKSKYLLSSDQLPNVIWTIMQSHYLLCLIFCGMLLLKHKKSLLNIKDNPKKLLSQKELSVCVKYLIYTLSSLAVCFFSVKSTGVFYPYIVMALIIIPGLYYKLLPKGFSILKESSFTTTHKGGIHHSKYTYRTNAEIKKNPFILIPQISFFFCITTAFLLPITIILPSTFLAKNVSYIGNKSLLSTPPYCLNKMLKTEPCLGGKDIIIKNGNLLALAQYYEAYRPTNISEIYYDIERTVTYANIRFTEVSWADNLAETTNNSIIKQYVLDKASEHDMTLLMFKKAILDGREEEFIQSAILNGRGAMILPIFESLSN